MYADNWILYIIIVLHLCHLRLLLLFYTFIKEYSCLSKYEVTEKKDRILEDIVLIFK